MGPANVTNAANANSQPSGASAPGAQPSDAQLENVLYGQGKLGEVGLGNVIDQFGVTDRFTAGQGYTRAVLGELWELFTSPSQTTASIWYTLEAQNELLDLLQNKGTEFSNLGSQLADASRALDRLQTTLRNAGLTDRGFLGKQGPEELRNALEELEKVYNEASDDWKQRNKDQMDERRAHINQKLADLAETVGDLNALASRLDQLQTWLDSLRFNPDGSLRGPVDLFNPLIWVRLGSIATYLRGMGADAFGLTNDVPFRMVVPEFEAPPAVQPANANVGDFEDLKSRLEEKWREFEETEGTEIDPELQEWLDGLDSPSDAHPGTDASEDVSDEEVNRRFEEMRRQREEQVRAIEEAPDTDIDADFDAWLANMNAQ